MLSPLLKIREPSVVRAVSFSPDGRWLLIDGGSKVKLWQMDVVDPARKNGPVATLPASETIMDHSISYDSQWAATVSYDNHLRLWNLANITQNTRYPEPQKLGEDNTGNDPKVVVFSEDRQWLAVGGTFNTFKIYNISTIMEDTSIANPLTFEHSSETSVAAFSCDSKFLMTTSTDSVTKYWDLTRQYLDSSGKRTAQLLANLKLNNANPINYSPGSPHNAMSLHPSGQYAASLFSNTSIIWNLNEKYHDYNAIETASVAAVAWHADDIIFVKFSDDGRYLLTAGKDNRAKVWGLKQLQYDEESGLVIPELLAVMEHSSSVVYADFHPLEHFVVTASSDQTARLWDLDDIQPPEPDNDQDEPIPFLLATMRHGAGLRQAVFHPGGRYLVTTSEDRYWALWEIPDHIGKVAREP